MNDETRPTPDEATVFTLRNAADLGKAIAAVPGVTREATPIGLALWRMWNGRVQGGAAERVVDGVPEEVWTQGLARTNTDRLAAWLSGRSDCRPTWSAWVGIDQSAVDIPAEVQDAAYRAVNTIWSSGC